MTDIYIYIYIYHNIQCQTSQLKTWTNNLNSILPKKWLKSTWKGAQQHQSLGKHKTMRYYNIPIWMTSNKKKKKQWQMLADDLENITLIYC